MGYYPVQCIRFWKHVMLNSKWVKIVNIYVSLFALYVIYVSLKGIVFSWYVYVLGMVLVLLFYVGIAVLHLLSMMGEYHKEEGVRAVLKGYRPPKDEEEAKMVAKRKEELINKDKKETNKNKK
jgi:hypothetical protein